MPPSRRAALAAGLFALSGLGALVVETLWLRWFRLLLGATAPAVSATLVAFFAGQVAGALWGGHRARKTERPLATYGAFELLAAAAALGVPLALIALQGAVDGLADGLRERPGALTTLRFAVAFLAAAPAGVCFGATLPPLLTAVLGDGHALGRHGALLVGANTLGAAAGVALASFWLPEALGVRGGYALGVAALCAAGALALVWSRRADGTPAPSPAAGQATPVAGPGLATPGLLGLAAVSGIGVFAGQSLLVQAFGRVLNQSTQAFGVVLLVVLVALCVGAFSVALLARRVGPRVLLGWAAVAATLGWASFPALFVGATDGLAYWGSDRPWPGYLVSALGLALATAGPPLLASGLIFPAVLHGAGAAGGTAREAGGRVGALLAANTAGAVAGALLAPYLLLPWLGLWMGFAAIAILYGVAAVLVPAAPGESRVVRDLALGLAWFLVISRGAPTDLPALRLEPGHELAWAEETPAGLVAVVQRGEERFLQTDNHYALGGSADRVHQERQGHVPLLLAPDPSRVLFLGSATGSSAGAALAHPTTQVTLVELVPGVARAASWFREVNRGITDHPSSRVVLDDARSYLRSTRDRFDAIVADLFVPWRAGTGSLYSAEHFRAAREHLNEGGVFCQWLPLYQLSEEETRIVAATFHSVFPGAAVFRGDFYGRFPIVALIGWRGRPPSVAQVEARVAALSAAGETDRWVTDPVGFWSLHVGSLSALASQWAATPLNRDDRPRIEFLAARSHSGGRGGKQAAFVGSAWVRFAKQLRQGSLGLETGFAGYGDSERRAGDGGHALQTAGALYAEGHTALSGQALASAVALLPGRLLEEAPADPTAANVWVE